MCDVAKLLPLGGGSIFEDVRKGRRLLIRDFGEVVIAL
jgi:hypothetical protein